MPPPQMSERAVSWRCAGWAERSLCSSPLQTVAANSLPSNSTTPRDNELLMKPRIGVYLSQDVAARLAVAVALQRPGISRSALVETAIDRYLGRDEDREQSLNGRIGAMSLQLEQLTSDLKIVGETVALQARFHLAMTPRLPEAALRKACMLGAERFDEFVGQVQRRVLLGTSLMRETMERLDGLRQRLADTSRGEEAAAAEIPLEARERDATMAVVNGGACALLQEHGNDTVIPKHTRSQCNSSIAGCAFDHQRPAPQARDVQSSWFAAFQQLDERQASTWQLILRVFLPFVAAYYLSFLFRTINATIAGSLASEFGLGAGNLGLLTSAYFLTFAAAQIPIGILLDRYGPRVISSVMLLIAATGAALFAVADGFWTLLIGRALIGLGVAAALTGGLKALVLWFPNERISQLNGLMIMVGALGVVTATLPAEFMLASTGWRGLFALLAVCSLGCAVTIYLVVPSRTSGRPNGGIPTNVGLRTIYADRRFWRLAPLSATCIGTAWSLQGLWAASWFRDVEGLDRPSLLQNLFVMAIALSFGALVLGVVADRLRRRGVGPGTLLQYSTGVFILAQVTLVLRVPLPSLMPWIIVAAFGAATVLSYAVLAEYVPKELAGRANAALNVFHIGGAFILQYLTGMVVQLWPSIEGHYPGMAYQTAFAVNLCLQIAAGIWFALPGERARIDDRRQPRVGYA
jgi:MFS family permease